MFYVNKYALNDFSSDMYTGQGQMCDEGEEVVIKNSFPANYDYKVVNCNVIDYKEKDIQCNI